MQNDPTMTIDSRISRLTTAMAIQVERETFMRYVEAIGAAVGHDASAALARAACPREYDAWRAAHISAYGSDPANRAA